MKHVTVIFDFEGWFGNKEKRAWVGIQRYGIRGRGKKKRVTTISSLLS